MLADPEHFYRSYTTHELDRVMTTRHKAPRTCAPGRRDRDQPDRHAGIALQPHGPLRSRDHGAGKGLDGMMLGLVACS